uniref:Uncharacterized protein n=1 Tax=Arundo donax TaxID=35708 RepID=A0A0A9EQZ7_ARUDO
MDLSTDQDQSPPFPVLCLPKCSGKQSLAARGLQVLLHSEEDLKRASMANHLLGKCLIWVKVPVGVHLLWYLVSTGLKRIILGQGNTMVEGGLVQWTLLMIGGARGLG